jgi:hypothetical protein
MKRILLVAEYEDTQETTKISSDVKVCAELC